MATCTAPGHPSCTITCSNGCGAIYVEPNGPCRTFCSRSVAVDISPDEKFSIQINDMPADEVEKILGVSLGPSVQSTLKASRASVSISEEGITLKQLADVIQKNI